MVDFLMIATRPGKRGIIEVYPKFKIIRSSDLMIRGGDFYAVWIEERGLWSTDEQDVIRLVDRELDNFAKENKDKFDAHLKVLHMWDSESGMIDQWHKYCQRQMRDSYHPLDRQLIFSNHKTEKKDYATKSLPYPLEPGSIAAYDKLMSTLYDEEEREKIEWSIGAVVTGDSKEIQKFLVIYGAPGTGKSTVFNILEKLFEGYWSAFDAKALGSASNVFALEAFKNNPLIAMQHDGDLSKLEDNTRLNSLTSHETMRINEKFKSTYDTRLDTFLIMGTNSPVKITNAKSGLIRRLIDVSPSGNKLPKKEYKQVVKQIDFELGAIAHHCKEVYLNEPDKYDDYVPIAMLGASNDFYNFVLDSYLVFKKEDGTTLKAAWEMYKTYCDDAKVPYPFSQRIFKEELKNYFRDFNDRLNLDDGNRVRSYYSGFITDKFEDFSKTEKPKENHKHLLIDFNSTESIFDKQYADCFAQYATKSEKPLDKWDEVTTKLSDLDTKKLHYVKVPENHIVIDFDIADKDGKKCFEMNLEEASKWPSTYAELSKSGAGIHLHYIYTGDVTKLSRVYDDRIEVKVFTGKSSLRRKLTKCNDLPIAKISSGLPLKGDNKVVNAEIIKSEKGLRTIIKRNLNKEIHPATKPSIDFIHKILDDAYKSGMHYDVTDMRHAVLAFAANSTNRADYCIRLVNKMQFKSLEQSPAVESKDDTLIFYDVEVFPNLFVICWKAIGEGKPVVRMINPKPADIEELLQFRLVGFNCRQYDNHMIYGALMGYNNEQLYKLSQRLVSKDKKTQRQARFGEAFNLSYMDVHDCALDKQSLKKWEIVLGIHHQELGLPWDQPVPENLWTKVAEYCDNDVIATEAVYEHIKADRVAREILSDLSGLTVNDTTNTHTTKIIFGNNRNPQDQFNYRDMGKIDRNKEYFTYEVLPEKVWTQVPVSPAIDIPGINVLNDISPVVYEIFDAAGKPYFPGYKYEFGKSIYRGIEVGEGGWANGEPGIYYNVALLDVKSMHPHSVIAEELFGPVYTKIFKELVDARVAVKEENWELARVLLDGKLTKHIQRIFDGEITSDDLATALKRAINAVYGLTFAPYETAFRDKRNVDNIVAKRGALFMVNLKFAIEEMGFEVIHVKTDSIKVPDATPELIEFIMNYGKMYGYEFDHEATYDRICLVNDAVYIAKYATAEKCQELYGYVPKNNRKHPKEWTATGTQFAVPYLFKTLFSRELLDFEDMCEVKTVKEGIIYLDMNENLPDVTKYEDELDRRLYNARGLKKQQKLNPDLAHLTDDDLRDEIAKGHNYIFVGKVGQFCPIKEGRGGGVLYRYNDGKYYALTGTKGYRWLESEMVKVLNKEDDIDRSYYDSLVDAAVNDISQYGDFEHFIADDTE